ncbi:ATP-binding cassette domain-containing protein [Nonomuraea polychroma]|uniref:ATP-binding cassette domain-containing protein n=1 Tax=Nonomuraea polychroma TaxID=46176 RepID=UPI003D92C01B
MVLRRGSIRDAMSCGVFIHLGGWTFCPTVSHKRILLSGQLADGLVVGLQGTVNVAFADPLAQVRSDDLKAHPTSPYSAPSSVIFGRDGTNADVEIDDITVLARHAIATPLARDGKWQLYPVEGLLQWNGRAVGMAILAPGERFVLGKTILTVPDTDRPSPSDWLQQSQSGSELQVVDLCLKRGGRLLLDGTKFSASPGQFVAIVGPSGAGKTTLLDVILGGKVLDSGCVTVDGLIVAAQARAARPASVIHYVPHDLSLHDQLSVYRTLWYAVALRSASDLSIEDRRSLVLDLAHKVDIRHRLKAPVNKLSSGERKRLSLAVELAADPRLLILDEPGSGLDAARDRALMKLLKLQSMAGTTVVCVTHNVDNLNCADQLVALGRGGRVAFNGRPQDALAVQGVDTWADAMATLGGDSEESSERQSGRRSNYAPRPTRLGRPLRTWRLLTSRQVELTLMRGRPHAARAIILTTVLPLLGAIMAIWSAKAGWRSGPDTGQLIALLATSAALTGTSLTYSDLVSEARVIKREHRIGVSGFQVVTAKLTVAAAQSIILVLIMVIVYAAQRQLGGPGALGWPPPLLAIIAPLFLVMLSSASAGLLLSAASDHLQRAVTLVTAFAIMQVALNHVLFDLPGVLQWVTVIVPTRTGVAAQAAYLGLPHTPPDPLWTNSLAVWLLNNFALVALTILFVLGAGFALDRRCRRMD